MLANPLAPGEPIRVLLVEHDEADYWHARDLLDAAPHARFTIDWARDLQTGLARLAPAAFDVCLLEQTLPDGDGLEMVRAAPSRGCDAPIIVLTGRGSLDLDLQAMDLGVADYLEKSRIDAISLERTIRYALSRRQQSQRLSRLAQHDELTGLANRSLFHDRLERALAWARRHERIAAVMVLDLNGFKAVNDRLGHGAGDRLLTIMGRRLAGRLRETDTVARLGGDEFALVIENLNRPEHAGLVARKLLDAVVPPVNIDAHEVAVTASLGVALYPQDGSHGAALLREADRAMYRAKAEGGNLCRFSSDQIERRVQRGALLESDLRRALERNELALHYQPQVNLADAEIGIAALLRWQHPDLGLIGAEQFMPLAEDSGMLEDLTDWIFEAASTQGRAWQAMGFHQLHVAVPLLSRRQLAWSGLAQRLQDRLHAAGLDPCHLEIELGEDVLLGESATGLHALKELGVRIALDGFGRGPTSLRSLQLGIVDTLKLAREWHHAAAASAANPGHLVLRQDWHVDRAAIGSAPYSGHTAVVGAIITLARELGLRVVAESVDDPAQLKFLRRRGCTAVQGLMTDAPLPADACTSWLRRAGRRRHGALAVPRLGPPAGGHGTPRAPVPIKR